MKSLDNPHIIKLYEAFEDNDQLYLVLEYCDGGTLFRYIIEKNPEADECLEIFAQILRGFRAIHEKYWINIRNFIYLNCNIYIEI